MFGRGTSLSLSLSLSLACLSVSPAWGLEKTFYEPTYWKDYSFGFGDKIVFKKEAKFDYVPCSWTDECITHNFNYANGGKGGELTFEDIAIFCLNEWCQQDAATFDRTYLNEGIIHFLSNVDFSALINKGTIDVNKEFKGFYINNYGSLTFNSSSIINSNINNEKGATLNVWVGSTINSNIVNKEGGTIIFKNQYANAHLLHSDIENYGKMIIEKWVTFKGKVVTSKTSEIEILQGSQPNDFKQEFINNGKFTNLGWVRFDEKFINVEGATFANNRNATFYKGFENKGTLIFNGVSLQGDIDNYGTIEINEDGYHLNPVDIKDTITTHQNSQIIVSTDTKFDKSFTNVSGATFTARKSVIFENGFINYGILETNGSFLGTITTKPNSSIITREGRFQNTLTNVKGATFTAHYGANFAGCFTNYGLLQIDEITSGNGKSILYGTITTKADSQIIVTGASSAERGTLYFGEKLTNVSGATFTNNGADISFEKGLTNNGTLEANGGLFLGTITTGSNSQIISAGENTTTFHRNFVNGTGATFTNNGSTDFLTGFRNQSDAKVFLNGATLKTTLFYNHGTLRFSMRNSTLGQLIADSFFNEGGKILVNVAGLTLNQRYQIILSDNISGIDSVNFIGGSGFYENGWIWIVENSGGENPDNPDTPNPTPNPTNTAQNSNYDTIKSTLENKLLVDDLDKLHQSAADTDETIKTSLITQPKNMMEAFKSDTLTSPLNSAYVSRLTASSKAIMNDSSNFINPLERASQTQFFATPFGGVLAAENLSGTLFGMSIGLTHIDDEYIAQGYFSYAKGKSTQDLTTQSTELNANLFQVGAFTRLFFYEKLETDINANFIFGKFELNNAWLDNALLNSNSKFNNYQANLGATLGYRFGESFSLKPFVGVQGYYEKQGEFKQESGLELTSETYSSLVFDALAGLETRYIFDNGSFIFAKASYENQLYNSHKEIFMRVAHNDTLTYENESYDNVINANIGARLLSTKNFKLDIEALFKHYGNGIYFGGNLSAKVSF